MFRVLDMTSSEYVYNAALRYNMEILQNLNMSQSLKIKFAILLAIYPMDEKTYDMFSKMNKKTRLGFLSKYLMKICRKRNVGDPIIQSYIKTKKEFSNLKSNMMNSVEMNSKIIHHIKNNQSQILLDIYKNEIELDESYKKLKYITKILLDTVNYDFNKYIKGVIRNSQKEREIQNANRFAQINDAQIRQAAGRINRLEPPHPIQNDLIGIPQERINIIPEPPVGDIHIRDIRIFAQPIQGEPQNNL